jgi:uncharacterized protein with GYD domain
MGMYLLQWSYSREALRALMANPVDRAEPVGNAVESVGGKLRGFWYRFGEFDGTLLMEMPDDASAAAFAIACGSTEGIASVQTTPLMETSDGIEAFRKAAGSSYAPPS